MNLKGGNGIAGGNIVCLDLFLGIMNIREFFFFPLLSCQFCM